MNSTTIFTGNDGSAVSTVAAATAFAAAAEGRRTLYFSIGPSYRIAAQLGAPVGGAPQPIAPGLDALALDALEQMATVWLSLRSKAPGALKELDGDEMPVPPGAEFVLGLLQLNTLTSRYEQTIVDAGSHSGLLRALSMPDAMRWGTRLFFGLDRGPGRNQASLTRAVLPVSLLPIDMVGRVQEIRVAAEQQREQLLSTAGTTACYVLQPDAAALADARVAIPALQLHGLAVQRLVCGPLLPNASSDERIREFNAAEQAIVAEAAAIWPTRPVATFERTASLTADQLCRLGTALETVQPGTPEALPAPIAHHYQGTDALVIDMPGLPAGALKLTHSNDEMIIVVGPYRRHLLLPENLRGKGAIRAARAGNLVIVRRA